MLNISYFHFNPFDVNTWVVWNEDLEGFLVDPGCSTEREFKSLQDFIEGHSLHLQAIVLTHGHIDHVLGVKRLSDAYGIPVHMGAAEKDAMAGHWKVAERFGLSDRVEHFDCHYVEDGDVLTLAGKEWTAIATPGHSPGGVCWWCGQDGILFSGDTLFRETIGRTDLYGGDYDSLIVSVMDRLMGLPGDTDVLPGHGSPTKISHERTHNPFLQPWGEKEQDGIDWDEDGIELDGR